MGFLSKVENVGGTRMVFLNLAPNRTACFKKSGQRGDW
jgi:hypothetical protein